MEDRSILFPAPTTPAAAATTLSSNNNYNNYQQQNNKFAQFLTTFSKKDQEELREILNERSKKLNENCVLTHLLGQLIENGINVEIARDYQKIYKDFNERDISNRHERIFDEICSPCTFIKLGLLSENIEKPLKRSCMMTPSNAGSTPYNLGPFIHAATAYQIDEKKHPHNINNNYAKNLSFPPGVVILPDSQIMMQILAMNYNRILHGVKICMINSDEENVTDEKIISRFMWRNSVLNCGYYKRNPECDISALNKNKKVKTGNKTKRGENEEGDDGSNGIRGDENDVETIVTPGRILFHNDDDYDNDDDDDDDHVSSYIPSVDDEDNFNADNIFQNGEPLIYKNPDDEPLDPQDIGMRVFDINNTLIAYIKNMTNLQKYIENQYKQHNKNVPYILNPSMIQDGKLITTTFYDLLSYVYHGAIDHDKLLDIPPLNEKCLLHRNNILFVNRNGKAITIAPDPIHKKGQCTSFKFVMKNMKDSPLSHKIIPTASNTNLTSTGNVPNANVSKKGIKEWDKAIRRATSPTRNSPTSDEIKAQNSLIHDHHVEAFHKYHTDLKSSKDILKNYYCEIKDDEGNTIPFDGNEIIYDIARKIYPEKVLDTKSNRKLHTLDFAVKNTSKPLIDQIDTPNVVYIKNLGFVSLTNICHLAPLTLKGSTVYYQNLINRFSKERNSFIAKSSETCMLNNAEDDDEDTIGNVLAERVNSMPIKHSISENAIKAFGEGENFDHNGHLRRFNCEEPDVHTFLKKYRSDKNPACIKSGI